MNDYVIAIDGAFTPPAEAKVGVLDHGFLFGDSISEVVRTVDGKLFAAQRHLRRLHASAAGIGLTVPHNDAWYIDHMCAMHARKKGSESYLRVIITRGVGMLDLHPESCPAPTVIGIAKPLTRWDDEHYAHG